MTDTVPLAILLTTYLRTELAVKTVEAIRNNLDYGNVAWWVSDDGSPEAHRNAVLSAIGSSYQVHLYNSLRRGVGHGMNHCLREIFGTFPLTLVVEDDWILDRRFDIRPYVNLLMNNEWAGMIRFGYLSPNLLGFLVSAENKLLWRLEPNGETYRFAGHPSLRHTRFHQIYGYYDEGLAPGMTELSVCGKTNQKPDGPSILYPAECGAWGFFGHAGAESLADISPQ